MNAIRHALTSLLSLFNFKISLISGASAKAVPKHSPLPEEKVKCIACRVKILKMTYDDNSGYCAGCAFIGEKGRAANQEFKSQLDDGSWFKPLVSERENIIDPFDLVATTEPWKVNPEGYEDLEHVAVD